MRKVIIIVVATIIVIAAVTVVRYFTRTGIFKGRKNKGSNK